ncbi:imidazolonepropionase [bacterium]|nr:imidazolonepropionase [bacterium]
MQVFQHIRQLLTLQGAKAKEGRKPTAADLGLIEDAAVAVRAGKVDWIGKRTELPVQYATWPKEDCNQNVWLPALVECHTHLVFGGERYSDYALRCTGKTYQEIAQAGGGILSTVKATRSALPTELLHRAQTHAWRFESMGVGCLEVKSGYGLTLESEITQLDCIAKLASSAHVAIVPTFLPAHAVPPEYKGRADAYVDSIVSEWIPEIGKRKLARFFDAFIEEGYFTVAQARRMVQAAYDNGLKIKLHVDQFTDQKGTAFAAEIGATSCDHLDNVSAEGIRSVAASKTVAVLAPSASLFTGTPYPPARQLIDQGAIVALTTDFNPGTSPSHNLPLAMTIACSQMKMSVPEAIVAATYNAAQALGETEHYGTIEVGHPLKVWKAKAPTYEAIPYAFGEI